MSAPTARPQRPGAPPSAGGLTGIVWIASYPKSGNTWTRVVLNNLLRIMRGEPEVPQDINRITEFTLWDIGAKNYERHLGRPVQEVDRKEIAAARPRVQADLAARSDGLALVKTHHAMVLDRGMPTINMKVTAGAIYIVRDPRDIALSFAHHLGVDADTAIKRMETRDLETEVSEKSVYEVYGSWSQHVESWTRRPHRAIHVMRYEDMLAQPDASFGALARHLLLTPTPEQLARAIAMSSFETLRHQEEEGGFREKPKTAERFFRSGRSGEGREQLSAEQLHRIESQHAAQMQRFGYLEPGGA